MADKAFRILLDVTDLHLQNFRYVWIHVSPLELKTISDLKKCASRKLSLEEEDVELFVRFGLLLDEETITVLREDDTVKIKYKNPLSSIKESLKENANFSLKRNLAESDDSDENANSKRYKPEIVNGNEDTNFVEKSSEKGKRKKQTESSISYENCHSNLEEKRKKQADSSVNFENCLSALTEENHLRKKKHKKKDKKKSSVVSDQIATDINFHNTIDSSDSIASTSQEQNKGNTSSDINLLKSKNSIVLSSQIQSKELIPHQNESSEVLTDINSVGLNNKKRSKRKRKRSRKPKKSASFAISDRCDALDDLKSFSESDDNTRKNQESNCLDDTSKFQNSFTDTFILEEYKSNDIQQMDSPEISTPAHPNNCSVPDWQLSLIPCKNSNLSCAENDSALHDKSARKNSASQNNRENKSEEQLYKDLPNLTSLPVVGTHLAYKVLELDENYSPVATDYREGIVEKVNPKTEEIEIRLKREIILPARSGRFENLEKDEIPEPTIKKYDVLKWCNMISPKIISYVPE